MFSLVVIPAHLISYGLEFKSYGHEPAVSIFLFGSFSAASDTPTTNFYFSFVPLVRSA